MDMEKALGGSPLGVIIRLIVISLIVGVVMKALGLQPFELVQVVRDLVVRIYELGYNLFDGILDYFLLGAVIVVPIFVVYRVLKTMSGGDRDKS